MTGYGAASSPMILNHTTTAIVYAECRTVNGRFLDLSLRVPEELRGLEGALRELVGKKVNRGKVELKIYIQKESSDEGGSSSDTKFLHSFDQKVIEELQSKQKIIQLHFPLASLLSVKDILTWPGILKDENSNTELLTQVVTQTAGQAMDALLDSRGVEGLALSQVITQCVDQMEGIVNKLEPMLPLMIQNYQNKLFDKLHNLLMSVNEQGQTLTRDEVSDRIKQEVVLYGVKIDVAEEIARLKTHFKAVKAALTKGSPVGKRLDFLMQELQRESNTLGSKSVTQEASDASMELKLIVEQIREQVQNLE